VSLFFALSGYLITGLLVRELDVRGRLRLGRFYLRRFARLMPALLLMVGACALFLAAVGLSVGALHVITAVTYTKNVEEILTERSDGFFGHTWSLAVEEHFYLVWPVVLVFLHRRLSASRLLAAVLALCAGTVVLRAVLLVTVHPSATLFYEATPVRADALLLGCAAFLAVRIGWRPGVLTGAAGLTLFVLQLLGPELLRGPLLMSTVIGIASAVLIAASDQLLQTPCPARLARVFRTTADLSYPVYLWHFPVMDIAVLGSHHDSTVVRLVGLSAAVGLSYVSLRFVERPVLERISAPGTSEPGTLVAAPG
jgi:peptidoglycan/LPS O-acetylase OafA/YrhL